MDHIYLPNLFTVVIFLLKLRFMHSVKTVSFDFFDVDY